MKISEFAELNHVTTKMLRHYDKIDLLKPSAIDTITRYRLYEACQSHYLNWILILKNLDFSLTQIKEMLNGSISVEKLIGELIRKRIEISLGMNEYIQKKIQIDKLIEILEKEGFCVEKQVNLLHIEQENVHEIKKNMPNMEMFLEAVQDIAAVCAETDSIAIARFDISHFKQVNDEYGFDVGDRVIVACYHIIKENIDPYKDYGVVGRAHGDEFIFCIKAGQKEVEDTACSIVQDMEQYDFSVHGCEKQMGCYIGGLVVGQKSLQEIRSIIESSIETINEARKKGTNGIVIRSYM